MRKVAIILAVGLVLAFLAGNVFAEREFYGTVEKLPQGGYIGEWVISGRIVVVTPDTKLDFEHGLPQVGSYVEVEGVTHEGKYIAREIETKRKW
jgi:hypothetical protein